MNLIIISLAPVLIILIYVYFRDKYEKEPINLLLKALLAGAVIVVPIIILEKFLSFLNPFETNPLQGFWSAFVVAGFSEELFKFAALYFLIWKNSNFNEKFDGIVYAVFISLGFGGIENILYVSEGGAGVALTRAWTAVPAHAIFGITMGYYFGIAKMYPEIRQSFLRKALAVPILIHGIYDFILMSGIPFLLALFLPFVVYLYYSGLKRMKVISDASVFRHD
ncbi:MAG: PrsW family intramembrane metalloprotease [Bacteroidales bacterium]|nr:PrsW family intramembrane metalloprotease [Bacteroidales bacterium]MCF8391645.1 PrsW family intramembrane metalloprotease [Bacteroidales bacterium]